ncbi:hypothetical protein JXO52_14155 [bacterium]|nr:hypothetical protein [bacterium]
MKTRNEKDFPEVTAALGWRYHHLGIPTGTPVPGERFISDLGIWVAGFDTSPFGIEWMRFAPDCAVHPLVRTVPHLAFVVDDLEKELSGREVICDISSPCNGIRVAMIVDNGAPIELMEFDRADGC